MVCNVAYWYLFRGFSIVFTCFSFFKTVNTYIEYCIETINCERICAGNSKINNQKVKLLCETRWVEKNTSLEEFEQMYEGVLECLSKICDAQSRAPWDSKTVTEATGLSSSISTPGFLCAFACKRYLFGFTKECSSSRVTSGCWDRLRRNCLDKRRRKRHSCKSRH